MKAYHNVRLFVAGEGRNVPRAEAQSFAFKLPGNFIAIIDYIFFEVQPNYIRRDFFDFAQIMMNGKSQVRFSGAKIKDLQRLVVGFKFYDIG